MTTERSIYIRAGKFASKRWHKYCDGVINIPWLEDFYRFYWRAREMLKVDDKFIRSNIDRTPDGLLWGHPCRSNTDSHNLE